MTIHKGGVSPSHPSKQPKPPTGGSGVPPLADAMQMLLAGDRLAQAVAAYFRAIDGEGDPKAIRQAVEELRAAHGRYEASKQGVKS